MAAVMSAVAAMMLIALLARGSSQSPAPTQAATKTLEMKRRQDVVHSIAKAQRPRLASATAMRNARAVQQSLDESMVKYNDASGLLITRHYDFGLQMLLWWDADARYKVPELPGLFAPEATAVARTVHIESYSDIQDMVAQQLGVGADAVQADKDTALASVNFPAESTDGANDLIIVFKGTVFSSAAGEHEIFFDSNAGGVLNVTDEATGETIQLINAAEGISSANITLASEGTANIYAYWKAVDGVTPRMIITWKGPSTDGVEVPLEGRHWTDTGPGATPKGVLDDGDVKHGWGCRFYYYESALTTLPNVTELLNTVPNAAAKIDDINISSHQELWAIAGEEGDEDIASYQVAAMCMGLVKINTAGDYQFDMTSDDGVGLTVDNIPVLNQTGEVDPFTTTSENMKLLPGYHEVIVTFFMNGVQGNAARPAGAPADEYTPYEKQTGGQVLVAMYHGPDTGDTDAHPSATPAGPVMEPADATGLLTWLPSSMPGGALNAMLLKAFYMPKGFGDIKGLVLKNGKTVTGHLLGYSASKGKFRKERSPLLHFDEKWLADNKDKPWKKYNYKGKHWKEDISDPASAIIKPWTDYSKAAYAYGHDPTKRLPVPDSVYTQDPPYDMAVVDIGGKGIPWFHKEGHIGDDVDTINGESAVMGQKYQFPAEGWKKTINSVPEDLNTPQAGRFFTTEQHEFGGGVGVPPTTFGQTDGTGGWQDGSK